MCRTDKGMSRLEYVKLNRTQPRKGNHEALSLAAGVAQYRQLLENEEPVQGRTCSGCVLPRTTTLECEHVTVSGGLDWMCRVACSQLDLFTRHSPKLLFMMDGSRASDARKTGVVNDACRHKDSFGTRMRKVNMQRNHVSSPPLCLQNSESRRVKCSTTGLQRDLVIGWPT